MRLEFLFLFSLIGICQALEPFTVAVIGGALAGSAALFNTLKYDFTFILYFTVFKF